MAFSNSSLFFAVLITVFQLFLSANSDYAINYLDGTGGLDETLILKGQHGNNGSSEETEWEPEIVPITRSTKYKCDLMGVYNFTSVKYLRSPNYPSVEYPDWSDCRYVIQPAPGYYVRITVLDRRMEPCCDFIMVYFGEDSIGGTPVRLIRGSKNQEPLVIDGPRLGRPDAPSGTNQTSSNTGSNEDDASAAVTLRFISDPNLNSRGFLLRVDAVPVQVEGASQRSSVLPESSYIVESTVETTTTPSINASRTAASATNATTTTTTANPLDRVTQTPGPATTVGPADGCPPPVLLNDASGAGLFISPNYPRLYPNSIKCYYEIRAPNAYQHVQIRIDAFETEPCCDYLELYDGTKTLPIDEKADVKAMDGAQRENANGCGYLRTHGRHSDADILRGDFTSIPRRTYTSRKNFLCLAFHSDAQNQFGGFLISYRFI